MQRKRILLFSIFFSILVGSLMYYVLPDLLRPLRRDPIPSGAYIVPWMRPQPSFEAVQSMNYNIDVAMADALKVNVTFIIEIPRFNETRVISSTVYLGHDETFMYIGGKFRGMGTNPASTATILTNYFQIFFDVANDGLLTFPEVGSELEVAIGPEAEMRNETDTMRYGLVWSYDDLVWSYSRQAERYIWRITENYYYPNAQPGFAYGDMDALYDKTTRTVTTLFSRYLWRPSTSEFNGFQMRRGERWTVGFLLELGYDTWYEMFSDFIDGWPRKTYPYLDNDASWWPKLVIDLSNPPPNL